LGAIFPRAFTLCCCHGIPAQRVAAQRVAAQRVAAQRVAAQSIADIGNGFLRTYAMAGDIGPRRDYRYAKLAG
jgi:hypothetical protein